jgi:hypothetical protein
MVTVPVREFIKGKVSQKGNFNCSNFEADPKDPDQCKKHRDELGSFCSEKLSRYTCTRQKKSQTQSKLFMED